MMDLHWSDFPDAPQVGAFLFALGDIPEGGVLSRVVDGFPVLAMMVGGLPKVFVNACPHQFLPLDHHGDQLLSEDGEHLLCTNHSAKFRARDGEGIAGEGLGCRLSVVPVVVRGKDVVVAKES